LDKAETLEMDAFLDRSVGDCAAKPGTESPMSILPTEEVLLDLPDILGTPCLFALTEEVVGCLLFFFGNMKELLAVTVGDV
jgi:hypothetical protein